MSTEQQNTDRKFLLRALSLAKLRKGSCAPNPAVGAIVVKNGKIIAEGYHYSAGYPHAEVEALSKLGSEAQHSTLYVTLEPCCMWGRTPPCTSQIIERKIGRVVYSQLDPDPRVEGKGEKTLRGAKIAIDHMVLDEITEFYKSYSYWKKTGLAYVTAKLAITLDGKIAGPRGRPIHFTGPKTDIFTHEHRMLSDAIFTTAKTVRIDNPRLNVRLMNKTYKKPLYVLGSNFPEKSKIFHTAKSITVLDTKAAIKKAKLSSWVRIVPIKKKADFPWQSVIKTIGADGIQDLWVEGGGLCFSSILKSKWINRAFLYISPLWLGENAKAAFNGGKKEIFHRAKRISWLESGSDAIAEALF